MKKVFVVFTLLCVGVGLFAQNSSIIENVLIQSVDAKIVSMKRLIGFDDEQAVKLRQSELSFLLGVNKTERCFLCNKKKRIEKLKKQRDTELQKILQRDQYIKYQSLENDLLNKENRLWLGN